MDTSELLAAATRWRDDDVDPETRAEVDALLARGEDPQALAELRERFAAPMEFGTAGLRGLIGAGPGRMNIVTVMQASAAVARQLLADVPEAATRGVVIGRDARRNSDRFARVAAEVIAAHGVNVWWVPEAAPTPVVAFLGRHVGAAGVVIVTASHNPPEYNGYKVYGPSASQIVPPQDGRIRALRDAIRTVGEIPRVDFVAAVRERRISVVGKRDFDAYLEAIDRQCLLPNPPPAQVSAVTTALHGVGHKWVADALARRGHRHVFPVLAQAAPDGRFPTVRFPNPEEKGALDLALALARDKFAELVLANDPDTDRLCVAVRDEGSATGYRVLTGNELGLLLADWIMTQGPRRAGWPDKPLVACSLVSTMMLEPLAAARGVAYAEVLTGFKWIWHLALERARTHGQTYVFGFEEALGYCVGPAVRDKDGVGAAQAIMELAAFEKARGRDLLARLDDIAAEIGASFTDQVTAVLPGLDGIARIKRVMQAWRATPPAALAGHIARTRDLAGPDAEAAGMVRSDVLTWWLTDGARIIARPSGTEPKLKVYLETKAATREAAKARAGELAVIIGQAIDAVA
ncbi:MAG: phospho-sugar mutase [Deltaproteobacteria bacterium]|nr:phospho-sugar mutase [Deltaproteobacteria bacterium]